MLIYYNKSNLRKQIHLIIIYKKTVNKNESKRWYVLKRTPRNDQKQLAVSSSGIKSGLSFDFMNRVGLLVFIVFTSTSLSESQLRLAEL